MIANRWSNVRRLKWKVHTEWDWGKGFCGRWMRIVDSMFCVTCVDRDKDKSIRRHRITRLKPIKINWNWVINDFTLSYCLTHAHPHFIAGVRPLNANYMKININYRIQISWNMIYTHASASSPRSLSNERWMRYDTGISENKTDTCETEQRFIHNWFHLSCSSDKQQLNECSTSEREKEIDENARLCKSPTDCLIASTH